LAIAVAIAPLDDMISQPRSTWHRCARFLCDVARVALMLWASSGFHM